MMCFPGGASGEDCLPVPEMQETWCRSLGQEDPLEEGMATHSGVLAWKTPWAEGPGATMGTSASWEAQQP